jgi:hypothetical protein
MEPPIRDDATTGPNPIKEAPSDIAAIAEDEDQDEEGTLATELDPRRAYEVLEIHTPLEEFEAYVGARIETLTRLGETAKAELTASALELGRRALARVTGVAVASRPDDPSTKNTKKGLR